MKVILTHENCDFDALASIVAATKLYPDSLAILPETLQPNVRSFINLYRDLLQFTDVDEPEGKIDTVIVVDTNRKERLGKKALFLDRAGEIILYDHHPGQENMAADLVILETLGATTTLLLEKIFENNIELTEFETTLFALGIYEDTGCLTYEITTARDVQAVARLWDMGIKIKVIQQYLRLSLSDSQKSLFEILLHNSELLELNQRSVLISTASLDHYVVGASVLLQLIDEIEDAGITIVIIEMSGSIYVAARTRDDDLNLLELLAPFGVRGYPAAVTVNFRGRNVGKVKDEIIELLNHYLPPAVTARTIATTPVFAIASSTTISDADEMLAANNYKGCPVIDEGHLVGIISRRDLQKGLRSDLAHAPVKGFMSRKVIVASPESTINELSCKMIKHNIGRIPIVDKNEILTGIVTRSDLLRYSCGFDKKGHALKKNDYLETASYRREREEGSCEVDHYIVQGELKALFESELSPRWQKLLIQVGHLADRRDVKAYLVGGVIRDLLLGYPLEDDLDFVITGDAIKFAENLQKLIGGSLKQYEQFGTATLGLKDGLKIDLVSARKEYYAFPAALPEVEISSLKNDLSRRDFTINTMACSLSVENFGELYDYYGGRKDLRDKKIRALYHLSFVDDPLRILRAVRFEQRYGFTIEPETLLAIQNAVEKKVLEKVSRQRLYHEYRFIFDEPSPLKILERLDQLGLFPFIFPRHNLDPATHKRLRNVENVVNWAASRRWSKMPDVEMVYLGGILYGLESADHSAIIRKLSLSRERATILTRACTEAGLTLNKLERVELRPSEVVAILENLPLEAIMLVYAISDKETIKNHLKLYMDRYRHIRPELTGSDLQKIGLEPGPLYRGIIGSLRQAVLDGAVRTPQEELEYVIKYLEKENREVK